MIQTIYNTSQVSIKYYLLSMKTEYNIKFYAQIISNNDNVFVTMAFSHLLTTYVVKESANGDLTSYTKKMYSGKYSNFSLVISNGVFQKIKKR